MRETAQRRRVETFSDEPDGSDGVERELAPSSVGIGALPRFAPGAAQMRVAHSDGGKLVRLVRALIEAGEVADVDRGQPLIDLAMTGIGTWLDKSWGGMRYFEFRFDLCGHILEAVDDAQPDDPHSESRLREAVLGDLGVAVDEDAVGLVVGTTGQNWLRVGPKVLALEREHPGLGWNALNEVMKAGVGYGMLDFSWLEMAAQDRYWAGGESESDWAEAYGEELSEFSGVTRAEFDQAFPVEALRTARPVSSARLKLIAGGEDWSAEVARLVLKLRKIGDTAIAFDTPRCDEANELRESMDVGVVIEWDDTETVRRIVDDYMSPYMESGESMKDCIGAIGLRLDGGKHMMELTRQWRGASQRLKAADALIGLLAEEEDGTEEQAAR